MRTIFMSTASPDQPETERNERGGLLAWLLLSVVAVSVLAIAAVHAPARMKLLGLFALLYGLLAGWLLGKAARATSRRLSKLQLVLSFLLIATGQCGVTTESHRLHRAAVMQQFERSPEAKLPRADKMRQLLREGAHFSAYLQYRVSRLGAWPEPWPAVFWGFEVLVCGAAGTWLTARLLSIDNSHLEETDS
jgi:hypothetical protein